MRIVRLLVGAAGLAGIGYGLFLALTTIRGWSDLIAVALWFGLPPVIFDLIMVPVLGGIGIAVGRWAPPRWRPPVITGLIISGAVLAVGSPFLAGFGRRPDNPSVLDRPYLLGTAVALAVVWAGIAVWGLLRQRTEKG